MDRERRRSTPLPVSSDDRNSIASDIDFRSATEAMQRAADAMIAATESFRKQFHQQDINTSPENSPPRRRIDRSTSYSESSSSGANNARERTDRSDRDSSRPPRASSTRRRPASYQPYRPASENSMHPTSPPSVALPPLPSPNTLNTQSAPAAAQYHRPASATGSLRSLPGTTAPATQYYMYRTTTRASTGSPAPPVSLHNPSNMVHNHLLQAQPEPQTQAHTQKLPISEFSTSRPVTADATTGRQTRSDKSDRERFSEKFPVIQVNSGEKEKTDRPMTEKEKLAEKDRLEKEQTTRDDSGIAMVMSVSNPRLLLPNEVPVPLAMHPVQLPLQESNQHPSQQPGQRDAEKPVSSSLAPSNSVSARTSHASWSLMPRIPKSPEGAAHSPSRRLTTPTPIADSVTFGGANETRDTKDVKDPSDFKDSKDFREVQDVKDFRDSKEKGQNNNPFTSVPVGARVSPVSGRRPSMSSYIDLIEAASRLKRTHSYQGIGHAGESIPRDANVTPGTQGGGNVTDDDRGEVMVSQMAPRYADIDDGGTLHHQLVEPEPVLQIGRYTYVRSEDASNDLEYRASLIRNMQTMQTMQNMQLQEAPRYSSYPGPDGSGSDYYHRTSLGAPAYRQSLPPPTTTLPPQKPPKKSNGPHGFSLLHETLFVLVICLAQVLMLAGIAQALVPAKIMGQSFPDTNPGNLAWYTASYGLTAGTFVLPAGRLGDLFGHRKIFILGFAWFAIWSLIAGFAPMVQRSGSGSSLHRGTIFFIVARTFQGIGPAMLVPNGQAMLGRAYSPGPRKNMVMSLLGAAAPLGFVVGAVMSSLFAVYASWPWAFWTMAAVCVALAAISILVLPADAIHSSHPPLPTDELDLPADADDDEYDDDDVVVSKKKLARVQELAAKRAAAAAAAAASRESLWVRMDGLGIILGVAGLVLINFAFNQAPIVGWRTPYTYFLLIIGIFSLAAFLYVEAYQAKHPLVPLSAMRSTTNFVLGCTATGWGCFSVWVYYAVQVFENLRGWSPLRTSAAFAPAPITGLMASLLTGFLFSRGVKPHWVMLISMFAFFIGSLLFATSSPAQSQLYWFNAFFSILIMPFGMDMSNPAATILLSNSVTREHQGIAASLVVTFVNYAISLALGVAGSVESAAYDPNDLLAGYRAAQYFGLGLGGLGILFGTAFLCQNYLRTAPLTVEKKV
ncbi:mfs transporter of unknown specificity [Ophiostoma piceae UAMH 11346]|uniref:Major facilitator superfamily (MFS) profile domain-containing protein n=1 Tax=Ophiostoma piceae (strain UAMH 11346) TaxID=1262450 RepID=S3BX74_OPHP1|nr:mfs transporter of unknown specificity [Ophiostoma piceae UAMH 11346]